MSPNADNPTPERFPVFVWLPAISIVLAAAVGFVVLERTGLSSLRLDKDQVGFWEIVFKGVGGVVGIVGITITVSKYFAEKQKENHNSLLVAQAPFFAKRQDVYFRLVSTTAILGNVSPKSPARRNAESQFWQLYWGDVPLVADEEVSMAVDLFSDALYPSEPLSVDNHGILIRNSSMNLARACRSSLGFQGPLALITPSSSGISIASSGHAGLNPELRE